MGKRKTEQDYHELAGARGFKWVGEELPARISIKTIWKCENNHCWQANYNNIYNGWGCPHCSGNIRKIEQDYQVLAEKHGFRWVGNSSPTATRLKTRWRCSLGHEWEACYDNVKQGSGCPFCAGKARKTELDYSVLAQARGFKWLDEKLPSSGHAKTVWECSRGHEWEATYRNIANGSGCPHCADMVNGFLVSKPQRRLCEMLGGELNVRVGKYAIDVGVCIDDASIGIEYDCWQWHKYRLEADAQRDAALIALGWRVLRVKSGELLPSREQLDRALDALKQGETYVEIVLKDWGSK